MTVKMIGEHLFLIFASIALAIFAGVPLGICARIFRPCKKLVLSLVEILQTIPALALLGMIMVFIGAGKATVIIGIALYSLLPVVQNTYLGLSEVSPVVLEAADGMGMTRAYRLAHVELPLAFPYIFAGIRIATVSAVGVGVFSAFVGGGGLGSAIYQSIRVHNMRALLSATAVLMLLATFFDMLMAFVERRIRKKASVENK